jgi:hypothetical protein
MSQYLLQLMERFHLHERRELAVSARRAL